MKKITALVIIVTLLLPHISWAGSERNEQSAVSPPTSTGEAESPRKRSNGKLAGAVTTTVAGGVLLGLGIDRINSGEHDQSWDGAGKSFVGTVLSFLGGGSLIASAFLWSLWARGEEPSTVVSIDKDGSRTMVMAHYRF
jgi:predicted aconitase with swiveling domain